MSFGVSGQSLTEVRMCCALDSCHTAGVVAARYGRMKYGLSLCLTIASVHADNNGGYGSNNSELPILYKNRYISALLLFAIHG